MVLLVPQIMKQCGGDQLVRALGSVVVFQYSQIMMKVEVISLCESLWSDRGVVSTTDHDESGRNQLVRVIVE